MKPPMESPGMAGVAGGAKLDAETPPPKVTSLGSVTVSVAPSRFASVSGEGLETRVVLATVTVKFRVSSSLDAVFESASAAVMVTVPLLPPLPPVAAGTWNSVMAVR